MTAYLLWGVGGIVIALGIIGILYVVFVVLFGFGIPD